MTDISMALLEENKQLRELISDLQTDIVKISAMPNKATLYAKKAQVMKLIEKVPESGKHQQGWRYATSEDIKEAVRKAMAAAGLSLSFALVDYEMDRGDKRMTITGRIAFTLECSETGATDTNIIYAEAIDYVRGGGSIADKTFFKLYTTAEKYFLKTTFLISSGDELDSDGDAPPAGATPSTKTPPTKSEGPPPWRPTKNEFFAWAREEFGLENQDIIDELREAGFTDGYKVGRAPEMRKAMEKAQKAAEAE